MASLNNVPKEILDVIRDSLQDRRVKLSIKRMVNYESRKDKIENRVLAFSTCRLFIFTAKSPKDTKLDTQFHYLDIKSLESKRPNHLVITTSSKTFTFTTLEPDTDEVDHMITHIGTSLKTIFPAFPVERLIKKIEVQPSDRLRVMYDLMHQIEQKDVGPCGGFTLMYSCMCDFHGLTFRDEVAWDVDTIYLSQDSRELCLRDFDHLRERDLVPIVSALVHNTWFTSLNANSVRLSADVCTEILRVMKKNSVIESLLLSNTGISTDFIKKLSTISMTGTQLHKLDLSGNMIDDIGAEHIFGTLSSRGRPFTWLDMSRTKITSKGLNKMAEAMNRSPHVFSSLQTLKLSGLSSGNKIEDLQNLYTFLASPTMISYLDLSGTDIEMDKLMAPLQRGCSQNIVTLKLSKTTFSNKKSKDVVVQTSFKQFFASVFALKHLDLAGARIPPEALKDVLLGICSNRNLMDVHLDISGVDLTSQGANILQNCLTQNISSLNISNIGFSDQDLMSVLNSIGQLKTVKHLSMGRTFQNIKPKNMKLVMEELVNVLQDEDSVIESLSLADSRLKDSMNLIINALGSNSSLTEIDISGNLMGDLGARMLSKALQINNKLKTIFWDKNSTGCQGFEDVAEALEKNYTLKKMPIPVYDASVALQRQPEKTEQALQTIERLLQRNHSPQKYSSDQAYRLQQGFLISSTQQMVDRLVVQSQDTINALTAMHAVEEYSGDIETAKAVIQDADNSKTLLPRLHDIAIQSQNTSSPVSQKLKDISKELTTVLENQMKKTVEDMLGSADGQCKALMKDKMFLSDLQSGCKEKSMLPKDFTKNILGGVDTDIFNTLSELNLAVAAHVSDRVIDEVIERLSHSHKTLTNHLNECKKGAGRRSQVTKSQKMEDNETNMRNKEGDISQDSPKVKDKRKSMHARKIRPQSVIDGLDSSPEPARSTKRETPEPEIEIDHVPELPTQSLTHVTKSRPRRVKNVRPNTRQSSAPATKVAIETEEVDESVEEFFSKNTASPVVNVTDKKEDCTSKSSSTKSTPETKKKSGGIFNFGHKDKDRDSSPSKGKLGGIFSKFSPKPSSPSPKKASRVSDVPEETDDYSSNNSSLTRSVTENSSLRGSFDKKSTKSNDSSSPKVSRSSSSISDGKDKKLEKGNSLERTPLKVPSTKRNDSKTEKDYADKNNDSKKDSGDDSAEKVADVKLEKKESFNDKLNKMMETPEPKPEEKKKTPEVKPDEKNSSPVVKEEEKKEESKPFRLPSLKTSFDKADKVEGAPNAEKEKESEEKNVDKEQPEKKNEQTEEKDTKDEIKEDDKEKEAEDKPVKRPFSVAKQPGGPGGIGFGVNLLAEMKSKQEKRKSAMPTRPSPPSEKPADTNDSEEKKLPFGSRNLKPVSKPLPAKDSEADVKNNVPVKPSDNKSNDISKTGSPLLEKKAEPVASDNKPVIDDKKTPVKVDSSAGLKKSDSTKSDSADKPALVSRPSGVNKPPPPIRPRPPPPGSKPTPAPRKSMSGDGESKRFRHSYDVTESNNKPDTSNKPVESGIVYDSATLKMSVKDKISKFGRPGAPPAGDSGREGRSLSQSEKQESYTKPPPPVLDKGKSASLPRGMTSPESDKSPQQTKDLISEKGEETNKAGGSIDRNTSDENIDMTDSGIVYDEEGLKGGKDVLTNVENSDVKKTTSLPRNTDPKEVKTESPGLPKRPKSMFSVLESRPDLKKHTNNDIPETVSETDDSKKDGETSPTEEVILV